MYVKGPHNISFVIPSFDCKFNKKKNIYQIESKQTNSFKEKTKKINWGTLNRNLTLKIHWLIGIYKIWMKTHTYIQTSMKSETNKKSTNKPQIKL